MERVTYKSSAGLTWLAIIVLVLFVLLNGAFAYFLIGDRGQPSWDYRPVQDIPSASPYSVYQPLPYPQHVRGERGH
jgi:hypothetical protein